MAHRTSAAHRRRKLAEQHLRIGRTGREDCNVLRTILLFTSVAAPFSSNALTTSGKPLYAAQCSGVSALCAEGENRDVSVGGKVRAHHTSGCRKSRR